MSVGQPAGAGAGGPKVNTIRNQERVQNQMKNPRLLHTTKTVLATVALTGLMAGAAARVHASTVNGGPTPSLSSVMGQLADDSSAGKHSCSGKNSCKGQGGCKTGDAGCAGKNTCKGKGGCATDGSKKPS